MTLRAGEHELGPACGTLRLRTYREGLAARAGHDLVLVADAWHAHVVVDDRADGSPSVTAEIDLQSLRVVEGVGGVKPLSERDKEEIRATMQKVLRTAERPIATFSSTVLRVRDDHATLEGELALAGQTHPVQLEVRREGDGSVAAHAQVVQSMWGIKPYTGFFGTLKLRDAVEVDVSVDMAFEDRPPR